MEAGDVLGACVFNPPSDDRKQLDTVGEYTSDLSMLMSTDKTGCGCDAVPSSTPSSSLVNSFDRVLHLYANIGIILPLISVKSVVRLCNMLLIAVPLSPYSSTIKCRSMASTCYHCCYHNGECSCYH